MGRRGIDPNSGLNPCLEIALNVFCMHKTYSFAYILPFFIYFCYIIGYNRNKSAPGDHESYFKKVNSIPCGFIIMGTHKMVFFSLNSYNENQCRNIENKLLLI